jgi:hypothetical protein
MPYAWGVDSASPADEKLYQCVLRQFGKPRFWGRYLSTVPRASSGLTTQEISFLHSHGIKILPIYNRFRHAVGYNNGATEARHAASYANRLGIQRGTFLFANIEHFFRVNEAWIRGWVQAIRNSGYRSGFYHDPVRGPFRFAFCQAAARDSRIRSETVLWSAQPEKHVTSAQTAPGFAPYTPHCGGNVWVWQYGRDSKTCPIDTNIMDERLIANLF